MKINRNFKLFLKIFAFALLIFFLIFLILPPIIVYRGKYKIYTDLKHVEYTEVAIVFGAGITAENKPSNALEDRLTIAKKLYKSDKIKKIIVSGDNRTHDYNEPQVMYDYLSENGVNQGDITRDYAGRRTYDTCYRAKEIFNIKEAILISQGYHLPRAIFLCNKFGIKSTGYSATLRDYIYESNYKAREIVALYWSVLDVYIFKPRPILGEKIKL